MWTEFFDSELWSRTVLQLSHIEPAIKHGILALSTMHERYESVAPIISTDSKDFAFLQYMRAVKYSKQLLTAHQEGKVSLEMVLIACIIFTCYENLAGNYHTASMHLRNGLRILEQNGGRAKQSTVANVLYRFDFQAMTFSDNTSIYNYELNLAPACPVIQDVYTTNDAARDDLVGLSRCMLWLAGVADRYSHATQHPTWLATHQTMMSAFELWETRFADYQRNITLHEQNNPKIYAGNMLLKMSAITVRIIMGSGAGMTSEMAWDPFVDFFKTIVDLAETIPILNLQSRSTTPLPGTSSAQTQSWARRIAPNPATKFLIPTPDTSTLIFSQEATLPPASSTPSQPSRFSPSFELSPIVPLFVVSCRCRDPVIRRRAIALLLSYRRHEGVWDSVGAGMVATKCMAKEEELNDDDFLVRNPNVSCCEDVREEKRVKDIFVRVEVVRGRIDLVYKMTTGESCEEREVLWESRGDGGVA